VHFGEPASLGQSDHDGTWACLHACRRTFAMRPNSRTSFFLLSGSVIGCHILRLSLFFITILDAIYPRTRPLSIFLGRGHYSYTFIPTSSPYFHCNGRRFSLFWFGSLVLGLVEGFNGMEDGQAKLFHIRYMPSVSALLSLSYHTLATTCTALRRSSPQVTKNFHDSRVATTHFPSNRKV
jgi:hypothetical protein